MKKYEVIVEDDKAAELTTLLEKLPYVKQIKESATVQNGYTLASEASLSEDWLSKDDDELQTLHGL